MARGKRKPDSPFAGRWRITSLAGWDDPEGDGPAFVEFDPDGTGEFRFGLVRGVMDCRLGTRDGRPCVERTWDGSDEMDPALGRGWAVLEGGALRGVIFFHQGGDDTEFVAERVVEPGRKE